MLPFVGRVCKWGRALCIVLPAPLLRDIVWRRDDRVAIRTAGEKLILERIPLEDLAKVRTGEATTTTP